MPRPISRRGDSRIAPTANPKPSFPRKRESRLPLTPDRRGPVHPEPVEGCPHGDTHPSLPRRRESRDIAIQPEFHTRQTHTKTLEMTGPYACHAKDSEGGNPERCPDLRDAPQVTPSQHISICEEVPLVGEFSIFERPKSPHRRDEQFPQSRPQLPTSRTVRRLRFAGRRCR